MDWLDRWNRTALHWAVFHGHVDVCRALLEAGAKVVGTLGEQGGRILMADVTCGNLPNRVLETQVESDRGGNAGKHSETTEIMTSRHHHADFEFWSS